MRRERGTACLGAVLLTAALGLPAAGAHAAGSGQDGHRAAPSTAHAGAPLARPVAHPAAKATDQLLTFSEFPVGTAIDKQYQDRGIVFAGSGGGGTPFISPDGANPTSPVLSGSPLFHGGIQGRFVRPSGKQRTVSRFSLDVGYIDDPGSVAVTAYGSDGKQVAKHVVDQTGIVPVTVEAKGIASFRVDEEAGESAGFAIDNVAYPFARDLAALGDSYSSGEANKPFDPGTDSANGCHRSSKGWPRLLAQDSAKVRETRHIACSGATTWALTHKFKGETEQLKQLKDLKEEPGYVTMTMGGNDVGFADILEDCFTPRSNCADDGRLKQAEKDVKDVQSTVEKAYHAIKDTWKNADVVIVGYPRLFPKAAKDEHCFFLSPNEREGLNSLAGKLDTVLAKAAAHEGVEFVSVLETMNGHELCSDDSWIYPINLSGGQQRAHPTLKGQEAIEKVVRKRIESL
ncbi:SGNH/GDSL hydrolase family protein [Wenjunlia tyrosinilytica]|uniref:SGNH hydrolase-type esterase domain-containing protein n=1 Tax=Wenjunlia tyrosinilytica TaxID=1544741 RepID=A0A917ZR37_9ACTN|nr:SGNH/GDSL hydrolase family protein [Wenjunlia tyrosinilytica]GGO90560.1 hypothetical protein GCM10012280_36360 [Wenjunlia tyrosinilytica]